MSVLSFVHHALPVPSYISMPSAGIDISDTSIKYVFFKRPSRYSEDLRIERWGDVDLPEGVFTRGMVEDQEKFAAAMKEVGQLCGTPYVRVSLPEERAYIFETELQRGMSPKEIRGQLEFRMEENVPLSPRDAYFDYDILPHAHDPNLYNIIVTVYGREIIDTYYEACRSAGLIPLSFEVEAQAIARAAIPADADTNNLIIDFGKTRSGIGIVRNGALMYTSTIDIGGAMLSRTLRKVLGDVSESELTKIKNTQGLVRGADSSEVYDALITMLSVVKDEVEARIEYWQNRGSATSSYHIDSVILCGGSANLKGLPEYFTEVFGIPTMRADVWQNAFSLDEYVPPIARRYSYGYATAVGLALAGFKNMYD